MWWPYYFYKIFYKPPIVVSQSNITFTFSFFIFIFSGLITTSKKSTFFTFYLNFSCFIYKLSFFNLFFYQQFITQGMMAGHSNYKVATLHWWVYNMKNWKKKTKEVTNRISTLLYSTCKRAPVIFYHANSCWNNYTNKDSCSYLLDNTLCSSYIWKCEDKTHLLWWLFDLFSYSLYNTTLSFYNVQWHEFYNT